MKKIFVLDANVLLHDPRSIFSFGDNDIVIPIYAVEEIDNFKKEISELGQNARQVTRYLDELRERGSLKEGVKLDSGGVLKVHGTNKKLPPDIASDENKDNLILAVALDLSTKFEGKENVIFITQDINLRIRCDAIGISTQGFEPDAKAMEELYSGYKEVLGTKEQIDNFFENKTAEISGEHLSNEFLIIKDEENPSHSAIARHKNNGLLQPIIKQSNGVWGITARNKEQNFAFDVLLDDSISLVTLVGKAGTGKTLLAIAAGLQLVAEEKIYKRLLISRPIFPLGKDLGYLPGTVEEKLNPWMQPIFDNVEFLMGKSQDFAKNKRRSHESLMDLDLMEIEPLTYIRGRSIAKQFLIVDEAQNLTPHEVKTIVSRAGEGTKIVLTGDPYQIDNPYVDSTNNGLVHVVNRFMGNPLFGHVTLKKGERSVLAEAAANLL